MNAMFKSTKAAVWTFLLVALGVGAPSLGCSPPSPMILPATAAASHSSIVLGEGPHLFLDDYLIESSQNVTRQVNQPQRHRARPVIGSYFVGDGFNNAQHNVRVVYDQGTFKMWYRALGDVSSSNRLHYTTSTNGQSWTPPLDESYFSANVATEGNKGQTGFMIDTDGTYLTVHRGEKKSGYSAWKGDAYSSQDGFQWTAYSGNPVVEGYYGELWQPYWDEERQRYGLLHRWNKAHSWTDLEGQRHNLSFVRCYGHTTSPSFNTTWPPSDVIWCPDSRDSGITQFYVTSNVIRRGEYLITMLSISRDDLTAPGVPATKECPAYERTYDVYGTGYTVLAWSTDGETWHRDRHTDMFFEPSSDPNDWDHAIAWITDITEVGDDVYLYYGGYQYGHKVYCDRSIGLVKMKRDRYVAQEAGAGGGWLRTPLVTLNAAEMTLNVNAAGGETRVQVLDANGTPIPGLSFADCQPITTDSLDAPVRCARPLADVHGTPVHLEFSLRNAQLFAFTLDESLPTVTRTPTPTSPPTFTPTVTPTPTFTSTPTPRTLESRFFSVAPSLDGDLSEWGELPAVVLDADTADYVHPRQVPDAVDASAVVRSGWDSDFLYFALEIQDDVLVADSAQIWRDDSVELGLDGLFDHVGWQGDDHQFTVNLDGRLADFGQGTEAVTAVTRTVSGGWAVEVAVAVEGLGAGALAADKEMGFTFGLHDDDDGGDWDSYLIWAGEATNTSSEAYARLLLSGGPVGPTRTATPTPTPTATPTSTPTTTPTLTTTSTPTPTFTPTPTATATPRTLESRFFSVAPSLDGDLSEWEGLPAVVLDADTADTVHPRQVPDVADASAVVRSGWDEGFLYFALEIQDDVLVADSEQIWRDDSVELGLDGLFDHVGWQEDDHQFTVNLDGRVADFGQATEAVTAVTRTVSGGWAVEVAIAVEGLGAGALAADKAMGFTFGLHDDDDGGDWDSYLIWAGEATNTSSDAYARLLLSGGPEGPTPTATHTPRVYNGSIAGYVWNDFDGDGLQGADEYGLAGISINLMEAGADATLGTEDDLIYEAQVTGDHGGYDFSGLPAGLYRVSVDGGTLPADYVLTTGNEPLDVALDTDQDLSVDPLGYAPSVTIGDYVFLDLDSDGLPDPEETQGLNGVVAVLEDTLRGLTHMQVTDQNGHYLFAGLPPGTYTIAVWDVPGLRLMTDSPQTFSVVGGQSDLTRDFGFVQPTAVQMVWFEAIPIPDQVLLSWWMYLYGQNAPQFHVWRSLPGQPWAQVSSATVSPVSMDGNMVAYVYADFGVEPGLTYLYRLEGGGRTFGPWQVRVPVANP